MLLVTTAYVVHVRGAKLVDISAKLVLGLTVYGFLTAGTGFLMFLMIFAGAHTEPVGQALSYTERVTAAAVVALYAVIGWLMCSLINGGLVLPSSRK